MPFTRVLVLVFASAAAVFGQVAGVPRPLHIRGAVVDSTTRQPIPNAHVQMIGGASGFTSAAGTYDLLVPQIGSYDLKVDAQGYLQDLDHYSAVLDGQNESTTLDMQMYRPGVISGRLLDAETKQPIAGVGLSPGRVSYRLGQAFTGPGPESPVQIMVQSRPIQMMTAEALSARQSYQTNQDGTFRLAALRPGTYTLGLPPEIPEQMVNSSPRSSAPPAAPSGYRRQRWPNQSGVELHAGSTLELGDILLAREPLFKITGVLSGCPSGDDYSRGLSLLHQNAGNLQSRSVVALACGEPFSAENLSPGDYVFELNVEGRGQVRVGSVTVLNRDVELNPVLSLPLTITGSVTVPDNFPELGFLRVGFVPSRAPSVQVAPDGKFVMTQEAGDPVEVSIPSLRAPYYVSEILYNGAPLREGILDMNPYALVRELKIRIAADGAQLSGTVRKDDKPVPNSSVILVAWPERLKNGFPVHYEANAQYGQFSFAGVPPGSYRAIAVERAAWETELQKPGVLSGLASAGTQVDLAPSASRELTLEVRWIQLSQ